MPVSNLLDELPETVSAVEAFMDGCLEVQAAFDLAASIAPDERLAQSLRRVRNEVRQLSRGCRRTLNELRRVDDRAGKGTS